MPEVDLTRANHLIDPQLHVWGWEIPVYLFLGGVAAGLMVMTAILSKRIRPEDRSRWARWMPFAAPIVLSLGMGALFLDLEHKLHVFRFYTTFQVTSPMSWGAWILLGIYPATLLMGLSMLTRAEVDAAKSKVPLGGLIEWARDLAKEHETGVRRANVALGIGLGVYTGILLSTLGARAVWNSSVLGPLFLVSGVSTGAAFMMLFPLSHDEHETLRKWDMGAIGAELGLLALFLIGLTTAGEATSEAAALFLGGPYTATFWSLVVIGGLLTPFALETLEAKKGLKPTLYAPALLLVGGLALRWVFVVTGQAM
ncbi:MAG: NrfD/PsrC family molybdoenzyme membrane anchor subunit [Myxococcota bacterium]